MEEDRERLNNAIINLLDVTSLMIVLYHRDYMTVEQKERINYIRNTIYNISDGLIKQLEFLLDSMEE